MSFALENWDDNIDPIIADGIIRHMESVRGELSLRDLIVDIDLILKRIAYLELVSEFAVLEKRVFGTIEPSNNSRCFDVGRGLCGCRSGFASNFECRQDSENEFPMN